MNAIKKGAFDVMAFLAKAGPGRKTVELKKGQSLFAQGDDARAVYFIQKGKLKLTVSSVRGKEATISLMGPGDFLGEECVSVMQPLRLATATAITPCSLMAINKKEMTRMIAEEKALSEIFVSFILARNVRIQEDLIDQLFNSSEKRLARTLLLLAHVGKESKAEPVIPRVKQEVLAEMIGTTRSRVSFFMNRFRKLGFIEYNGELTVHSSLLAVVLHD